MTLKITSTRPTAISGSATATRIRKDWRRGPASSPGQTLAQSCAASASSRKMPNSPPKMKDASIVRKANPSATAFQTSHFVLRVSR